MRPPTLLFAVATVAFSVWLWNAQLFVISRTGEPRPLALSPAGRRARLPLDVALPAVPIGMERLRDGDGVLLVHYWAPWERHARIQVATLDSLRRLPGLEGLRVAVVCADPYPSVARYVARMRLRLLVLIDGRGVMREALPCPSMPFTYVIDRAGRVAAAQPGEIDWLAPATRAALVRLLDEAPQSAPGDSASPS